MGCFFVWVLKSKSIALPASDALKILKGQAEGKNRERTLKTFNTLLKYEKEKVLFPWQLVLWCFCWSNLPEKEDFAC